jgi:hypothetical protein
MQAMGNLAVVTSSAEGEPLAEQGAIGVQLAQLSPSLDGLGPSSISYGPLAPGADASSLALPTYPGLAEVSTFETVPAAPGYDGVGFAVGIPANDAGAAAQLVASLASVTRESDPSSLPADYLAPNKSYLFAIVGDPTSAAQQMTLADGAANPAYDGHGLHVIALNATSSAGSLPPDDAGNEP